MNFFNINVDVALKVWNDMSASSGSQNAASLKSDGVDLCFVTPTLLSLGKFTDKKIENLTRALNRQPALIWVLRSHPIKTNLSLHELKSCLLSMLQNLSGKPFSQTVKDSLGNQILDVMWKTPGQYTQVPSAGLIFSLCYSIKR